MSATGIGHTDRFLAHALAIESEAAERYRDLAEQMRAHHNVPVATLFATLADLEEAHATELRRVAAARGPLPRLAPWEYEWVDPESPESVPFDAAHYLMTPHQALQLALVNERRAKAFFDAAAAGTNDDGLRRMALEMAGEEAQHIAHVEQELARHPAPDPEWDLDLDPPTETE